MLHERCIDREGLSLSRKNESEGMYNEGMASQNIQNVLYKCQVIKFDSRYGKLRIWIDVRFW